MKAKIFLRLLLYAVACGCYQDSAAQSSTLNYIPTVFPKSPNAAAFDKYGNYPVNLNSGVPEISIPLYTIESGGLKVPITLSYHASGIRVGETASWVGMGWSLSTGGSITRNIMGKADEEGYLGNYQGIASMDPHHVGGLDSLFGIINSHNYDTRPDIYSYNMPGHGGKFFFNGKNAFKPTPIPFSPVQIKSLRLILDENGNNYLFSNTAKEVTSTYYSSGSGSTIATTAWMLEAMISQNRHDTISFTYTPQTIYPPDQTGETTIVEDSETAAISSACIAAYAGATHTVASNVASSITEQEISQINFKNGRVVFKMGHPRSDLTSASLSLDTIIVYDYSFAKKQYEIQKSIVFVKSYYADVIGGYSKLKLDTVKILDKAGSIVQHYNFTYDTQPVPNAGSFSKDLWGYYNGKMDNPAITNRTLIPRTQITFINTGGGSSLVYIGADVDGTRDPDSVKMQAGVLKRIDYPTGGHTDFSYETNRYFDSGGAMHLTGGLRVASISSYDSQTSVTPIVKTYRYNKATPNFFTTSAGQINYGFFTNASTYRLWVDPSSEGHPGSPYVCKTKRVRTYTSDPGFSLTPSEGNPVAYTNVTEYTGTPGVNIGKTVYTFTDTKDYIQTASYTGVPIIYDYSFARGQLATKKDFLRKADGSYLPVQSVANTYAAFSEIKYDAVGVVVGQAIVNEGAHTIAYYPITSPDDLYSYPASSYGIVSGDSYLTSSTTQIYDTADTTKVMAATTDYKYDNFKHQQVNRTYSTDSKGNTLISVTKYPADYISGGGASTTNILLDSMLNRNMQAEAIEKWDSLKNVSTSVNAVIGGLLNTYKTGNISGTIVPYKIHRLKVAAPLTDFAPTTITSGNIVADSRYVQMIAFDSYDSKNNILQYTPRTQTPTAIIWDNNYELPIAQVRNVDNSTGTNIAYTGFEGDKTGNWTYTGLNQYDVTAPTGWRSYSLAGGNITSPVFTNTKPCILSLWAKGTAPTVSYASSYPTAVALRSVNGWTYYEYSLPAGSTSAVISGTASIDELRLYPADAQMTTYIYGVDGLIQMADTKSLVSRFEYDFASRLKNVKDWNGNIVKNYGYHTYDMTFGNAATSTVTFTRDNCPSGTSPQSTTYAVAANTYRSSTQASADAMAAYDLKTNGQLKADDPAVCGCPVAMVNFTITNSTGINTFQIKFTGPVTYNFYPTTSSTTVSVQAGTYSIQIFPTGTFANHYYKVGSRSTVYAPGTTFTGVSITSSSNESPLTIN